MESITFNCKVITPMFLAGADGQTPELRAPSIKGAMRFWWRAMNGHLSPNQLLEREGKIFGDTAHGRSKVLIRIMDSAAWDGFEYSPTPHDSKFLKKAFKPGVDFTVKLTQTKTIVFDDSSFFSIKDLEKLFLLVTTLGGFGGRVRRGFGSLNIMSADSSTIFKPPSTIKDVFSLLPESYFEVKENSIVSKFRDQGEYPYIKKIEIGNSGADWRELLILIGESSSKSKSENNNSWDYKNSLGHTSKRYASPVYVSVVNINKQCYPIVTTLNIALENNRPVPRGHVQIQNEFKNRIL